MGARYCHLYDRAGSQVNESLLQRLAHETGGQFIMLKKISSSARPISRFLIRSPAAGQGGSCSYSDQMFINPTVKTTDSDIYMNTYLEDRCSVDKVVVRFNSFEGDIDYELVHRGQNYYAIKRGANEISDFDLLEDTRKSLLLVLMGISLPIGMYPFKENINRNYYNRRREFLF